MGGIKATDEELKNKNIISWWKVAFQERYKYSIAITTPYFFNSRFQSFTFLYETVIWGLSQALPCDQ